MTDEEILKQTIALSDMAIRAHIDAHKENERRARRGHTFAIIHLFFGYKAAKKVCS